MYTNNSNTNKSPLRTLSSDFQVYTHINQAPQVHLMQREYQMVGAANIYLFIYGPG